MRDRWVLVFVVFCVLQIPLYLALGRAPITFDFAIKAAELGIVKGPRNPEEIEAIRSSLQSAEGALERIPGGPQDSRQGRLDLTRALLAWHEGKTGDADLLFRRAISNFEATHGPDSFHTFAVSLRYAEFLMLTRRYGEALVRFEKGVKPLEDTMGPKNPLATRMVVRHAVLLSYMGRNPEAVKLVEPYLDALLRDAGKFDEAFLTQTGGTLDMLGRGAGLRAAPGESWRQALASAYRRSQERAAAAGDDAQ